MGVVYKAQDTVLDRLVALKFLPEELSKSSADSARFLQEAKAAAALNHPSICTIHGIEAFEGRQFIVMEFVDGQTLSDKQGSVTPKQAIDIAIQIADGLAAAHEKGITHRDIKPDNIMIRKDGITQIMDFGLAKLRGVSNLTQQGSTVGTARYMSPEQVQGAEFDHRSDIFSLGVLLYELFSGQLPFKGVHETALMYEIVNVDPQPISEVKPGFAAELDAIVLECLAKDPADRFQSAAEISKDLRRFKRESSRQMASRVTRARTPLASLSPTAEHRENEPARPNRHSTLPWILSGVLVLMVATALWSPWKSSTPPRVVRFTLDVPQDRQIDVLIHPGINITPDGGRIVYVTQAGFLLHDLNSLDPRKIDGTQIGRYPVFSPDGTSIFFFEAEQQLQKIGLNGGVPLLVSQLDGVESSRRGLAWTPFNSIFVSAARGGLKEIPFDGGAIRNVTLLDTTRHERTHRWPQVLPNGKAVIFTVGTDESPDYYESATIQAFEFSSKKRTLLVKGASSARYSPTGHLLYTRSGDLYAVPFDQDALAITGNSVRMIQGLAGDPTTGAMHYALSDNGTLVYVPGNAGNVRTTLVRFKPDGSQQTLPAPEQPYLVPKVSPDGKRIAAAIGSISESDIFIYDIAENTLSKFTFGGLNTTPCWSPDGKTIAYSRRNRGDTTDIVLKRADGTGADHVLWSYAGDYATVTNWSADGSSLLLDLGDGSSGTAGLFSLNVNHPTSVTVVEQTPFIQAQGNYSPDMKYIAFSSNRTGTPQIYVRSTDAQGGYWQVSTDKGVAPRWSRDGKTLYYSSNSSLVSVTIIPGSTFRHTQPRTVIASFHPGNIDPTFFPFDLFPDGSGFLTVSPPNEGGKKKVVVVLNWFEELKKAFEK